MVLHIQVRIMVLAFSVLSPSSNGDMWKRPMEEQQRAIVEILLITLGAGLAIPLGGWFSYFERLRNSPFLEKVHPFSNALGGGLLLSAVCLALIPEGIKHSGKIEVALSFLMGGTLPTFT